MQNNVISKSNRRYLNGPDKEHHKLGIRVGDKEMAKTLNKYFMSLLTAEEINVRNNGEAKIYWDLEDLTNIKKQQWKNKFD